MSFHPWTTQPAKRLGFEVKKIEISAKAMSLPLHVVKTRSVCLIGNNY